MKSEKGAALSQREIHAISRALSDPRRFEILKHIASSPKCAACSSLRETFPVTPATLSHHLKELETVRLIDTERRGKFVDVIFRRDIWDAYLTALSEI